MQNDCLQHYLTGKYFYSRWNLQQPNGDTASGFWYTQIYRFRCRFESSDGVALLLSVNHRINGYTGTFSRQLFCTIWLWILEMRLSPAPAFRHRFSGIYSRSCALQTNLLNPDLHELDTDGYIASGTDVRIKIYSSHNFRLRQTENIVQNCVLHWFTLISRQM